MNGQRKSDSSVVPMKPPNNARAPAAEVVEGRELAKGNVSQQNAPRTQSRTRAPNALASIKELLNDAVHDPLSTNLASERDHFVRNLHHVNGGIGIAAFLAKQTPKYE